MAILLQDKLEIEKSEWEGVSVRKQSVRAGRFLTDANITDVFKTLGPTLPDSVLLLTPGQSHMVALAAEEDAYGQLFEMNFEQKDLVIIPVNDATIKKGSEGKHWSLLVLFRISEGHTAQCFTAVLYDSARMASHQARAGILTRRFLGANGSFQTGECSLQQHGFDCGIYVLLNSEIILKSFLGSSSWYAFKIQRQWQDELLAVDRAQATAYRQRLAGLYQQIVPAEVAVVQPSQQLPIASVDSVLKSKPEAEQGLPPKTNQHRQGQKGSSTPHPWSAPYAWKPNKRTKRHFRELKGRGLVQLSALSEQEAHDACAGHRLVPPLEGNRWCWKCGGRLLLKTWKVSSKWNEKLGKRVECPSKQILACSSKKCGVRFVAKAYNPMHNTTLTFKAYLLLAYCWSTQKRIDQTTTDLKGHVTEDQVSRIFFSISGHQWVVRLCQHQDRDIQQRRGGPRRKGDTHQS